MGKPSFENLGKLLQCIKKDSRVVIPPLPGFDSGVHLIDGEKLLVVSTDPCIGVPEKWFGWLLIHYAASDVTLFGARPEFCTINLLGPPTTSPNVFHKVMKQVCSAADDLGMAIVTGHTGTYKGLSTLVGVCTAYGTVDKRKLITPGGAKAGDCIFCIKPLGQEIAVNFTLTHKPSAERLFGTHRTKELAQLVYMQSCVKEALILSKIYGVHAMHDATEGGLTVALNELAEASKVGFKVEYGKIPVYAGARVLQRCFDLPDEQVLSMSSTGTILAAVSPEAKEEVERTLGRSKVETTVLGVFTSGKQRILLKKGRETRFPLEANDPYERILSAEL